MKGAFVLAVYTAAALGLTWPLAINLTARLGALQGPGDPFLNLWILGWGLRAWTTDPGSVLNGDVFDANIFYPAEGTLAYSDHFLLQALALAPVYAMTRDAVLCYNLLLIVSIALSGAAMHALVRTVTRSTPAAFVAGLAWACWPYRTAHLLHLQLQALYFLPLAVLCLHRLVARQRWRDVLALAVSAALQVIASVYYGFMMAIVLAVGSVVLAVSTGQWRARRLWSGLAVAALLGIILSAPVLAVYQRSQRTEGFGRTLFEAANHSASWRSYVQVPPVNLLYGRTGLLDRGEPGAGGSDRRTVEHELFPGIVLVALALLGGARHLRSDARPLVLSAAALIVVGGVLSFGPNGLRALYAALHDSIYGFQAVRAPARFAVVAMLGLSLLAALGTRCITDRSASAVVPDDRVNSRGPIRRLSSRSGVIAVVLVLLALEYANGPLPLAPAPPRQTAIGQWLAREPTPGAVLYLPLTMDIENTPYMVQSLEHGRPIVNGYSGQRPAFFSSVVESVADLPSPTAFGALRELDVRFVVSPTAVAGAGNPRSPLVERVRLAESTIYEVRWTPEGLAALEDTSAPAPPPPGRAPFRAGESGTYEIRWDGGPVNLPAGTVTLRVLEGGDDANRWTFEARADTARWVSTFFQARDRFVTIADREFRPIEHVREIREGRRQLDRTYVYDHDARNVRVGGSRDTALSENPLVLPLASGITRDAIGALYYARTLELAPGSILTIPINEAGTNLLLQCAVSEVETIQHGGYGVLAIRLEPRVLRRVEHRQPLAMTIWLSQDERRVPLRAIVEAGFGRVRAELVDYRR